MFVFFSNGIGVAGSIIVSVALTLLLSCTPAPVHRLRRFLARRSLNVRGTCSLPRRFLRRSQRPGRRPKHATHAQYPGFEVQRHLEPLAVKRSPLTTPETDGPRSCVPTGVESPVDKNRQASQSFRQVGGDGPATYPTFRVAVACRCDEWSVEPTRMREIPLPGRACRDRRSSDETSGECIGSGGRVDRWASWDRSRSGRRRRWGGPAP
jgi:hypothetical protein